MVRYACAPRTPWDEMGYWRDEGAVMRVRSWAGTVCVGDEDMGNCADDMRQAS